jgi:hypothetical protein
MVLLMGRMRRRSRLDLRRMIDVWSCIVELDGLAFDA